MARRRRQSNLAEEDFQMAPMIDMVFLLLVFFMCVSTLAQAENLAEVELPESDESKVPEIEELQDRGTVSIDAKGIIYVGAQPVSIEQMKTRLRESIEANPELRIKIRADKSLRYREISEVMKACAEVGAYEIIFSTLEKS